MTATALTLTAEQIDPVVASAMVAALENGWSTIRERHPDVPAAVMTVGAGSIGAAAGTLKLGHFAAARWRRGQDGEPTAEIFIGGEGLAAGPVGVLGTLLHEAAHAIAHTRGITDTSRGGRYHNRRYAALAEEVGVTVAQTGTTGWSETTVPQATQDAYAPLLAQLGEALTWWRRAEGSVFTTPGAADGDDDQDDDGGHGTPDGGRKSSNNGVSASCECGRRIRVATSTYTAGPIVCGLCGTEFTDRIGEDDAGADAIGEDD